MRNIIFWFSGTGNSLAIAMDLADRLKGFELAPVARAGGNSIPVADRAGVVFPVYGFGLPNIVRRFLERVPLPGAGYFFTLCTMGGLAGAPHRDAAKILAERGGRLSAGWSISMPGNYPVLRGPPPPNKMAGIFAKAQARVVEIASLIATGATPPFEDTRQPLRSLLAMVNRKAAASFGEADSHFSAGPNCRRCALCSKVCPVANIRMVDGRPVWMHRCEQCMACLQWCPCQAIEYGTATQGKERYHHPRFKAMDLFLREE